MRGGWVGCSSCTSAGRGVRLSWSLPERGKSGRLLDYQSGPMRSLPACPRTHLPHTTFRPRQTGESGRGRRSRPRPVWLLGQGRRSA